MIARYTALGLLFILFFSFNGALYGVESDELNTLDNKVDNLVSSLIEDPDSLINELKLLLNGIEHNYHTLLTGLYISSGKYKEGEEYILTIPDYKKDEKLLEDLIYCYIGQRKNPYKLYSSLEIINSKNPMVLNYNANLLVAEGFLDDAEKLFLEIYKLYPEIERTYISLGDLYLKKVDKLGLQDKKVLSNEEDIVVNSYYEQAVLFYEKVKKGRTSLFYNKLASVYKKLGDKYNAIVSLNSAIELDPLDPWNYYDRGKIFFYLGNNEQALENFKKVYELSPDHFFGNVFLGRIYFQLKDVENATKHYSIALQQNSEYTPAWVHYSILSYIQGYKKISLNFQIDIYNKNIERNMYLSLFLLETLTEMEEYAMAKKIASELVKKEKNVTIKGIYSFYLYGKNSSTDTDALEEALELEDNTQRIRLSYYIANVLYREGVKSLAFSLLDEVKSSGVDYESMLADHKLGEFYDE